MFDFFRKNKNSSAKNITASIDPTLRNSAVKTSQNQNITEQKSSAKAVTIINPQLNNQVPTSKGSNNYLSAQEVEAIRFINSLIEAITGYSALDLELSRRQQLADSCLSLFKEYLVKYIELNYGSQDATRLRASYKYADGSIFTKFNELGPKFDEAYSSFISLVEKQPI